MQKKLMYKVVAYSSSTGRRLWTEDVLDSRSKAEGLIKRRKESGTTNTLKIQVVKSRGFAELVCKRCGFPEFFDLDEMPKTWSCEGSCDRTATTEGITTPGVHKI